VVRAKSLNKDFLASNKGHQVYDALTEAYRWCMTQVTGNDQSQG
jgi:hypothetical protein